MSGGSKSYEVVDADDYDHANECGCELRCGCWRSKRFPLKFLNCFLNPKVVLIALCIAAFLQGFIVNGVLNVSVSTLESRFHLQSSEMGVIVPTYDIGVVVALVVVTYVGGRGHKPLWLGWGVSLMGIGAILISLPHFIAPTYTPLEGQNICKNVTYETCANSGSVRKYRGFFFVGQLLYGFGASPIYTLGLTYIDENVKQIYSSTYHGIFLAFSVIGPGVGYICGAKFLSIFTNIWQSAPFSMYHPLFVGAWWMPFLVFGSVCVVVGIPIQLFPIHLPETKKFRENRTIELYKDKVTKDVHKNQGFGLNIKDAPKSLLMLLRNPTFLLVSLASAISSAKIAGNSAFAPKYISMMFTKSPIDVGVVFGSIAIVGGALGMILGGIINTKFNLNVKKMLYLCIGVGIVDCLLSFYFLIHCDSMAFAGGSVPYSPDDTDIQLNNGCNAGCGCTKELYLPVCGIPNSVTYFSPCHAGCRVQINEFVFAGCTCIPAPNVMPSNISIAKFSSCWDSTDCNVTLYNAFYACVFFSIVITFLITVPALQVTFRIVPFTQRSFAVGIQWVIIRCLGTIPSNPIFGTIFDKACTVWDQECGVRGSCRAYDNRRLSYYILAINVGCPFVYSIIFVLARVFYKSEDITQDVVHAEFDKKTEIPGIPDGENTEVYKNKDFQD